MCPLPDRHRMFDALSTSNTRQWPGTLVRPFRLSASVRSPVSLALVAFGATSLVEVFASLVVIWHLKPGAQPDLARRTFQALRLVSFAFLVLGLALGTMAIRDMVSGRIAGESWWGVAYLAITAVAMFALANAKRRLAEQHG